MDSARESGLYPPIKPFADGMLDVGDGHRIYYEMSGQPNGIPVVFLHGGPGAGTVSTQRRYFDPDVYCIVLFDQRGAGNSTPFASLKHNTTDHLVEDMEKLRILLDFDKWLVCGGSWGATLALAYGIRHAERCLGFILRGVFLGTQAEVDWFLHDMGRVFPEHHAAFTGHVGGLAGDALFETYCQRLFSDDDDLCLPAARAWARYESLCSTLMPHTVTESGKAFHRYALALARTEAHYFRHRLFLKDDELMNGLDAIKHLPAVIVQGRYDVVCPMHTAYRLHRAWRQSELVVVPDAGHSGMEPGIARAIARAADTLAREIHTA